MFALFTDHGPVDIESEREVWEGLKHTNFIGYKGEEGDTARSSKTQSRMSTERSKSELRFSPRTPTFQRSRSYSSPNTEQVEFATKPRSRSVSDAHGLKSYRPLQGQLSQIEGETQVIREQTEVSHFTDKEKSELSKLSEKADLADMKSELTLPADIAEEETLDHKPEDESDKEAKTSVVEDIVEEPEEEVVEIIPDEEEEAKSLSEVKSGEGTDIESEKAPEVVNIPGQSEDETEGEKTREATPAEKSLHTPSQSGSLVGDDVQGIPIIEISVEQTLFNILLYMFKLMAHFVVISLTYLALFYQCFIYNFFPFLFSVTDQLFIICLVQLCYMCNTAS